MQTNADRDISENEFRTRVKVTQDALRAEGLDALIVYADAWRTSNVAYLVDYRAFDGILPISYAVVLITSSGPPQLFVFPPCLALARSTWLREAWPLDKFIAKTREKALDEDWKNIGIAGYSLMPADLFISIRESLPGLVIKPTPLLNWLKAKKSPAEINLMLEAGRLTDLAMDAVRTALSKATCTERELVAVANYAMMEAGADGPAFDTMIQSGPNSMCNLMRPTDRTIQSGDMVLVDVGARFRGYSSDIARGICYGSVSQEARRITSIAIEAYEAGLDAVRPGATARSIDEAVRSVLREYRYEEYFNEASGHGIGHDPEEEVPFITPESNHTIEMDMTLVVKSALMVPEVGGIRIEDVIVVRENGPERITKYPTALYWS